jgi:hypothetical protein
VPSPLGIIKTVKKVSSAVAKKSASAPAKPAAKRPQPKAKPETKITANKSVGKRAPSKPPVDREARQAVRRAKADGVFHRSKVELAPKGLFNQSRAGTVTEETMSTRLKRNTMEKYNRMKSPDGARTRDGWGNPVKETRAQTAKYLQERRPHINHARAVVKETNAKRMSAVNKQAAASAVGVGGLFAYDYAKKKQKEK